MSSQVQNSDQNSFRWMLLICGVYSFIVRTFNEVFIAKLALATTLTVVGLYAMAYWTHAFIPTSIPFMFGFLMFMWVWFSRVIIRSVVKLYLQSDIPRKRVVIYGAVVTKSVPAGVTVVGNPARILEKK
jgi:FlaA1/EpsC-like NDP-sugar epimerase